MTKQKVENKEVFGFSRYSINTKEGKVINKLTGKVLTAKPNANGYVYVSLSSDSGKMIAISIHRLVMMAELGHDLPNGYVVDHIDGDRSNNKSENLRVITQSENLTNRKKYTFTRKQMSDDEIREMHERFSDAKYGNKMYIFSELAERFALSVRTIQNRYREFGEMQYAQ